jgi:hypothetical protein
MGKRCTFETETEKVLLITHFQNFELLFFFFRSPAPIRNWKLQIYQYPVKRLRHLDENGIANFI